MNANDEMTVPAPKRATRVGTYLVLAVFTFNSVAHEASFAYAAKAAQDAAIAAAPREPVDTRAKTLARIAEQLAQIEKKASIRGARLTELLRETRELAALQVRLKEQDAEAGAEFGKITTMLRGHGMPKLALERHRAAVRQFNDESIAIQSGIGRIGRLENLQQLEAAAGALRRQIESKPNKVTAEKFDPAQMPFSRGTSAGRVPGEDGLTIGAHFRDADLQRVLVASTSLVALQQSSALTPTPADLAATADAQITAPITALAARLDNDPVKIYEWVRANVDYVPSFGSIQGSDQTLRTLRGNSFDTSSLLVALLRAAGIPSRYAYGTIEVPIEKVMNWVGGIQNPQGAIDLLAQGGVPVTGIMQGGKLRFARFEHAWVRAFIDYLPSRGEIRGTPTTWVDLDASFKQYEARDGVAPLATPPFATLPALDPLLDSLQIDDAGKLSGLTPAGPQAVFDQAYAATNGYADNAIGAGKELLNLPHVERNVSRHIPSGLPGRVLTSVTLGASLPASLRLGFHLSLFRSVSDQNYGSPALQISEPLTAIGGEPLVVQYEPETEADRQIILALLPPRQGDEPYDPAQLPKDLPGYLVQLRVKVMLGERVLATAGGFTLGQEVASTVAIQKVSGGWHSANNRAVAGELSIVAFDLQGTGATRLTLPTTYTAVSLFNEAGRAFWAHIDAFMQAMRATNIAVAARQPSFGIFSTAMKPVLRYGIPYKVKLSGVKVDVDASLMTAMSVNADPVVTRLVVSQVGAYVSALEHRIPESRLVPQGHQAEGASTVKVFGTAVAAGQPLISITTENSQAALAQLQQSPEVIEDIRAAINAGYEVMIPRAPVQIGTWIGTGYVIEDPATGSAAYRISSGANGNEMEDESIGGALNTVGLGMPGIQVPPPPADLDPCPEDGEPQREHKIDWITSLMAAIALILLIKLLIDSGGRLGGTLKPAIEKAFRILMTLLIIPLMSSMASASTPAECPVFFVGPIGYNNVPQDEFYSHVAEAIGGSSPEVLTYDAIQKPRDWMSRQYECSPALRSASGIPVQCDEYPFNPTMQGGEWNYPAWVHLRLIRADHNHRGGVTFSMFLRSCGVAANTNFRVKLTGGESRFERNDGVPCR